MLTSSRVLFVSHSNEMAGAELCLTETVHAIKLQGINALDILIKPGGNSLEELLKANGGSIKHFDCIHKWVSFKTLSSRQKLVWLKRNFITLRKLIALFRELKPDYVITNTIVISP